MTREAYLGRTGTSKRTAVSFSASVRVTVVGSSPSRETLIWTTLPRSRPKQYWKIPFEPVTPRDLPTETDHLAPSTGRPSGVTTRTTRRSEPGVHRPSFL